MNKSVNFVIVLALVIYLFISPAYAFGFDIFTYPKKQAVDICEPDEELESIIYSYDGFFVTDMVFDFVQENGYHDIGIIIQRNHCLYKYTVTTKDSGYIAITEDLKDGLDLEISTSYDNALFAHKSYIEHDSFGILKSSLKVKMPIKAKINAIMFLNSYI